MYPQQLRTITAAALTAFAFVVFTAPAPAEPPSSFTDPYYTGQAQDLRSPDTRDIAAGREYPTNPTARNDPQRASQIYTDAQRRLVERFKRGSSYGEALTAARQASLKEIKAPEPVTAAGFDWAAAAAGAAAALGLTLLMASGALVIRRRA